MLCVVVCFVMCLFVLMFFFCGVRSVSFAFARVNLVVLSVFSFCVVVFSVECVLCSVVYGIGDYGLLYVVLCVGVCGVSVFVGLGVFDLDLILFDDDGDVL